MQTSSIVLVENASWMNCFMWGAPGGNNGTPLVSPLLRPTLWGIWILLRHGQCSSDASAWFVGKFWGVVSHNIIRIIDTWFAGKCWNAFHRNETNKVSLALGAFSALQVSERPSALYLGRPAGATSENMLCNWCSIAQFLMDASSPNNGHCVI